MTKTNKLFALLAVAMMTLAPLAVFIDESSGNFDSKVHIFYDDVEDGAYPLAQMVTVKEAVPKPGYIFQHWTLSGRDYHPGDSVNTITLFMINKDFNQNFKSVWKPAEYDMVFADENMVLETRHITFGTQHGDLPEVSKPGYTLVGWTSDGTEEGLLDKDVYNIPYSCTLTPLWKPNSYTAYLMDGGRVCDSVKCDYGKVFPELPTLTKPGYLFRGWSLNAEGTMIVDEETVYETVGDSKLYAVWAPATYTVTLFDGGVEFGKWDVKYNEAYGDLPVPKKVGMTFLGWSVDGSEAGIVHKDTKYTTLGDTKLYAVWKANEYTATFDAHGGSLSFDTKKFNYGSTIGEFPTCTKSGCTLKGWSLTDDGTSMIDANTPLMQAKDITIHAVWSENPVTPSDQPAGINLGDPLTLIALTTLIAGTVGACLYIYRRGLL